MRSRESFVQISSFSKRRAQLSCADAEMTSWLGKSMFFKLGVLLVNRDRGVILQCQLAAQVASSQVRDRVCKFRNINPWAH